MNLPSLIQRASALAIFSLAIFLPCARAPFASSGSVALGSTIWDAVADYSKTENSETSTWSYRGNVNDDEREGVYTLLPYSIANHVKWVESGTNNSVIVQEWNMVNSEYNNFPAVSVNDTGQTLRFINGFPGTTFFWEPNTLWLHPPGSRSFTTISWLAPIDAVVDINFSASSIDVNGGTGIDYFVELNNYHGNLDFGYLANGGSTGPRHIGNVAVQAGDRINFLFHEGIGDAAFDSIQFTATIQTVPEPTTAALAAIGLLLLVGRQLVTRKTGLQRR